MLGDLAKWLRLLGFDTLYFSSISDDELSEKTRETKRILLTSDKKLYSHAKRRAHVIFVPINTSVVEKLKVVFSKLRITRDCLDTLIGTRCVYCNTELVKVTSIEKVKELINKYKIREIPYDSSQISDFWFCPTCKKLYWKGRMWKQIERMIDQILGEEED